MEALLKVEHLKISYNSKPAVRKVSFDLQPGEVLAIVGESGCGKSSLLRAAMGRLCPQARIDGGRILFQQQDLLQLGPAALEHLRGSHVGMIFQNSGDYLCPVRSIEEQLLEAGCAAGKFTPSELLAKALKLLEALQLPGGRRLLCSYPFELSGGMLQRIGIMLTLVLEPDLVLADEPTSALDTLLQVQVVRLLLDYRQRTGAGMVLVTHNIGLARCLADRLLVMYQGELLEAGSTEQVLTRPRHEYTRKLIAAVPVLKM